MRRLAWLLGVMSVICAIAAGAEETDGDSILDHVRFSGLFYLTYEDGEAAGERFSDFFVTRAYLTTEADILPYLSGRVTLDTSQDMEGDGRGDMEVRLKYAFARFRFGDWGLVRGANLEAGIVHMVWLDFEEHVNLYRMRGPMFMERSGIFNSADFGLTLAGGFGPDLGDQYRSEVSSRYAARHGSFAVGLYNGSGYHGDERNVDKVAEVRLTWRPLPDALPGLQVSGLAISGEGNQSDQGGEPADWETYSGFVSYQSSRATLTAQVVSGRGNQRGTWVEPADPSRSTPFDGTSLFGEWRFTPRWRAIASYDWFDREAGGEDFGFERAIAALACHLGKGNFLVLDFDRRVWDDPDTPDDHRIQLVMQLTF